MRILAAEAGITKVQRNGIYYKGDWYRDDAGKLSELIGENVIIRSDEDLGKIYVYSQTGEFICEGTNVRRLAFGATREELREAQRAKKQVRRLAERYRKALEEVIKLPTLEERAKRRIEQIEQSSSEISKPSHHAKIVRPFEFEERKYKEHKSDIANQYMQHLIAWTSQFSGGKEEEIEYRISEPFVLKEVEKLKTRIKQE